MSSSNDRTNVSQQQPLQQQQQQQQQQQLRTTPNGKTKAASPMLSTDEQMELQNMNHEAKKPSLQEDVFQLARLGETSAIRRLIENGKFKATYRDEEGITALHWAAINNHYATCQYLISQGADVNAKGGEAGATPTMWAVQRCHYYVVHLLLQNGADTSLTDIQGYNLLHLATFDGNIFLMVLVLHQMIPVDFQDPQGHTSLMWAAFKGYPACVDMLLRWGANVHATDENGFTALHWSLVKGSPGCIQKLIEYGSDRFVETNDHKTPAIVADEMKSARIWHRALDECGYDEDGNPKKMVFPINILASSPSRLSKFFFFWPFLIVLIVIYLLSRMIVYLAIPVGVAAAFGLQWVAKQLLPYAPPDMRHIHRTPYLAGVFAGSCFWVGFRWFTTILPNTYSSNFMLNVSFAISYCLCTYFYLYTMLEDPGRIPKVSSRNLQKTVIEDLIALWQYDDEHFCAQCMIRKALRSKHCRRCGRCIAKHDHHCPWVNNCIGINNHRHFFFYIVTLEIAIIIFIHLALAHLANLPEPSSTECNVLASSICRVILPDTFTVLLSIWAALQSVWVTMLILVQLIQISRAQTTYENMRSHTDYADYGPQNASRAINSSLMSGSSSTPGSSRPVRRHGPHRHDNFFTQWKKLLGLDTFMATASEGLDATANPSTRRARSRQNPFSRGFFTNCSDFWCDPSPVFGKRESGDAFLDGERVNYLKMYEVPPRMKIRRGGGDEVYRSLATTEEGMER